MMKKFIYILLALSLISCGSEKTTSVSTDTAVDISSPKVTLQSILSSMENGSYRKGELLVRFKSGVSTYASSSTHEALGASVADTFDIVPNLELVKLPEGLSVRDAIVQYMSDPNVEYAEPNYLVQALSNDTYYGQQWAHHNTGSFAGGSDDADIDALEANNIHTGSSSVVVAVIDTGVNYNHSDLGGNMWTNPDETGCADTDDDDGNTYDDDCIGWDFSTCSSFKSDNTCDVTKSEDNDPMDDNGHGTHVAGIIAAVRDNNEGIAGVANVQLMPLKFLNANGNGDVADAVKAINYAVTEQADIINASYGHVASSTFSTPEYQAIGAANTAGILFIAAAGNGGSDGIGDNNDLAPTYPAAYDIDNIISAAATDYNDLLAPFSNYGAISVDVGAPGVYILSTIISPHNVSLCSRSGYAIYDFCSGTSMAAPHVSGLAGLLWSYYDHFTHSQIKSTILWFGDPLDSLNGWVQTGKRINAYKALSSLLTPTGLLADATTASSAMSVSLSWTDNATGENGYKIERSVSGGSFTEIADLPAANTKTYLDDDSELDSSKTYSYQVKAYNTIGNSKPSNVAIVPAAPTVLSATVISSSEVELSWTDNSSNETGFKIERKTDSGGTYSEIAIVGAGVNTYSDTGLDKRTYFYRVRSYTLTGNSAYSNEVSAKTGSSGGGGGNCSIGARQNTPTALTNIAVMLLPLVFIAIMRWRRKYLKTTNKPQRTQRNIL